MVGKLDAVQLPGEAWTVFPMTRVWSWGGVSEKSTPAVDVAAPCSPGRITWATVCAIVAALPFERGYIGALKTSEGGMVWYDGWKTLAEVASNPDAVLSVVGRLFDGAETVDAATLAAV